MRKTASRWVPHDLTEMQKWLWYDAARNHLERYEREGKAFLCRIITLDETRANSYEPQMKRQSNEWRHYRSPRKSKVRQNPSNVKVMVILVYDCDGVILTHSVPRQQTVNAQYYCSFLEHNLRPALRKKRRHFLQKPTHHFAGQCSAACSASCGWFVQSMGLGSAVPSTILPGLKPLWLQLDS